MNSRCSSAVHNAEDRAQHEQYSSCATHLPLPVSGNNEHRFIMVSHENMR